MPTTPSAVKYFAFICALTLTIYVFAIIRSDSNTKPVYEETIAEFDLAEAVKTIKSVPNVVHEDIKYILQWTPSKNAPFDFMGKGRSAFIQNNCDYTNCFVTDDHNYFLNPKDFDAVAFNGKEILKYNVSQLPKWRSLKQKFIFATMESAHYYPACNKYFNSYFNWTWTYRLDSDVRWGYITVYDIKGDIVGPKAEMIWLENMTNVSGDLKKKLESKTKAVAWFVSNCNTKSKREHLAKELENELRKYKLTLDVYGGCGKLKCPRFRSQECEKVLEKDYYFYLSFENSFSEDYVTEKVLTALNNLAVPIVYGGANYSRFLPPGSYLDAKELGAESLAKAINDIIGNSAKYHEFFRWRNHYVFTETSSNLDVCNLCALLNDEKRLSTESVYNDFVNWWNPNIGRLCT